MKNMRVAPPWCLHCEGSLYEDEVLIVEVLMPSSGESYIYHFHCLPSVARNTESPADQRVILDLHDKLGRARRRKASG